MHKHFKLYTFVPPLHFMLGVCAYAGPCHYGVCPKPFPVFLSPGSAVTALVYGCQKPCLLPWQCHTAIPRAGRPRLLQRRRENGECCRRNLLNVNQPLHGLSFIRPEKHSGFTLHSLSLSLSLVRIPISTGRNILFWSQSKLVWSDAMLYFVGCLLTCPWKFCFEKI